MSESTIRKAILTQRKTISFWKTLILISDFVAEPLFAKTGRGYLKSEGVSTIAKIKANLRRKAAKAK